MKSSKTTKRLFETDYGYFTNGGSAYVIKRPDTPRPWVNILANPNYGMVISQAGGGFSWVDHSTLSVLTRWEMDLVRDNWGKWVYLHDNETGELWSASPQPTMTKLDSYECEHGIGYTVIRLKANGIDSEWTLTVPPAEDGRSRAESTFELWRVRLHNRTDRVRKLSVCSHFMWCLGAAPDSKREFHRLFIETAWDAEQGVLTAKKNLWEVPAEQYGHWNTPWPYIAYHSSWVTGQDNAGRTSACGDHGMFTGRHGDWKSPAWLDGSEQASGGFGRYSDAVGAISKQVELAPGESVDVMFVLGAAEAKNEIDLVLSHLRREGSMDEMLSRVERNWESLLGAVKVDTPDDAFNILNNTWLMYQALSSRLWGRTGYWQQSGAFGFRDQLQDSQVWLPGDTDNCLAQIRLHARHQFADGTVYHWWHPLSEVGLATKMTDDLLWLPFVLTNYINETDNTDAFELKEPFIDDTEAVSLWEHGRRSINRVLLRMSKRGLPLIGEGDWNDGMSGCGRLMKGESVWMGHFLYMVLKSWIEFASQYGYDEQADIWKKAAEDLYAAVNEAGWDGDWYLRATMDDGTPVGSNVCKEGRIYLNAQTWAVIAGTAEVARGEQVMDAVETHLHRKYGPLLFTPAYSKPDQRVGYLTRYAPGTRENGGLYTHAGVWAIQAACKLGRNKTAWEMFTRIAPPCRGMDPDLYTVEPYVTPGNVYGPDTGKYFGQGGWSWYTGSAAWLRRICMEWILGVRPERDGLVISPCLPPHWDSAKISRPFRGDMFNIEIRQDKTDGQSRMEVDGSEHVFGEPIPSSGKMAARKVIVYIEQQVPLCFTAEL